MGKTGKETSTHFENFEYPLDVQASMVLVCLLSVSHVLFRVTQSFPRISLRFAPRLADCVGECGQGPSVVVTSRVWNFIRNKCRILISD